MAAIQALAPESRQSVPGPFIHKVSALVLAAINVLGRFLYLIFYCLVHNNNRRVEN